MWYHIDYLQEEEILKVKVIGDFNKESLDTITEEMVKEQAKHNCTKILLDHREARISLSTFEIYERPKVALSMGLNRTSKIAIAYSENRRDYHFLKDVACNRGIVTKIFTQINTAIDWLKNGA